MKPLVLIPQHFGSLIFDRRTARYLPFDHECSGLFRQAVLGPLEGPHLGDFLQHFQEEGFWDLAGRFDGEVLDFQPPADHLSGPLTVHLEVAGKLNKPFSKGRAGSATASPSSQQQ